MGTERSAPGHGDPAGQCEGLTLQELVDGDGGLEGGRLAKAERVCKAHRDGAVEATSDRSSSGRTGQGERGALLGPRGARVRPASAQTGANAADASGRRGSAPPTR